MEWAALLKTAIRSLLSNILALGEALVETPTWA
jgi:hypothetical protein